MLSLAEENYLKAIYHLSQNGLQEVLTNELAESMHTKAASVTDMIKKLSVKKLISYKKYYGVNMTSKGKARALQIIRKHRLWETFLVNKLGFTWDEVHEIAEQLEHIQSQSLIEKLDGFLGYPKTDPHGDPIPDRNGNIVLKPQLPLAEKAAGYKGTIMAVKDSDSRLLKYLEKIDALPGRKVQVIATEPYDGSMQITISGKSFFVSKEVSQNILVTE